ncbi:hypothetical protein [Tritonibacter multivorans]|nr:hypothetical protein [Tritonibacter multivorans]
MRIPIATLLERGAFFANYRLDKAVYGLNKPDCFAFGGQIGKVA